MSDAEIWNFLPEGTRTAHIGTIRRDGSPHVKPAWFVLDGEPGAPEWVSTTGADSVKGRTLRRDSRIAVSVDDPVPPCSFAVLTGTATLSEDPGGLRSAATGTGARYMGPVRAAESGARNGVAGELLVRPVPTRVTGQRAVSD